MKYVDEINYVVYETDDTPSLANTIKDIISDFDGVKIVKVVKERKFDWEKVTELYNEVKLSKPNDWWIIADIDEFHLYPHDSLKRTLQYCDYNGWEIVRGGFVDRTTKTGSFPKIKEDVNLFEQFPVMSFFRYPMSQACPNKICAVKGKIEITAGQHYAKIDGFTTWRWQGWNHPLIAPIDMYSVQVHHFKWDETAIERIKDVANLNQEYAYSAEYNKMYDELNKTNFVIDITKPEYMTQISDGQAFYSVYRLWDRLMKKIASI